MKGEKKERRNLSPEGKGVIKILCHREKKKEKGTFPLEGGPTGLRVRKKKNVSMFNRKEEKSPHTTTEEK